MAAVAAHRYEPPVAGAARLHAYLRNDPKFIAVIVGVLWAHRVKALGIWVRCPETSFATASVPISPSGLSSDRNEEAEGDAERLFMLAAEVVGVARLNEPAEVSFRRRPNLKIEQRHRAE